MEDSPLTNIVNINMSHNNLITQMASIDILLLHESNLHWLKMLDICHCMQPANYFYRSQVQSKFVEYRSSILKIVKK